MATSGSIDFTQTRDEIITDALIIIGAYSPYDNIDPSDLDLGVRFLNKMLKAWDGTGIHLWLYQENTLFLEKGVKEYSLGSASGDARFATTISDTTLSADEASGQTVLSVTSSTGMTASDAVGIELDDATTQWTTIDSVDSTIQITVTDALTGAASSGNRVYAYTSRAERPLRVHSVRRRRDEENDIPLIQISRQEYFDLPNKDSGGEPVQYFYNPDLTSGTLYVWPEPDQTNVRLKLTCSRTIQDLDAASDTGDFPQEWLEAVTWNLALRLGPAFGKDEKVLTSVGQMAVQFLSEALDFDVEDSSLFIEPFNGWNS